MAAFGIVGDKAEQPEGGRKAAAVSDLK